MPELPEVETIRRDVAEAVLGRRVSMALLHIPVVVKWPAAEQFVAGLTGRTLVSAERVGKYLMLGLDDGKYWVIHLSLEGRLLLQSDGTHLTHGTLLVVNLDDGQQLVLRDHVSYTKTFLLNREDIGAVLHLNEYGPEPITPGFSEAMLRASVAGRRGMIKPLLLDQRILTGVGNIYADEALFRARIHPERRVNTVTDTEWTALHAGLVAVLREGIADRGTTAPGGLYRDLYGRKGQHQDRLSVFRRAGEACPRCRAAIRTLTVGGRVTFCCPNCQLI
jgi:formamidopyrimidine-DNA glycosylase